VVSWALTMVIWAIIIYVLVSWINPHAPVAPVLSMLLRPMRDPIRRVLPPLGGLDLSPMVLGLIAYILQVVLTR
jgi:YggT family protein